MIFSSKPRPFPVNSIDAFVVWMWVPDKVDSMDGKEQRDPYAVNSDSTEGSHDWVSWDRYRSYSSSWLMVGITSGQNGIEWKREPSVHFKTDVATRTEFGTSLGVL